MLKSFLGISFLLISTTLFGQEISISYVANEKPLNQVLKDLEKEYDLHFAFSPQELKGKRTSVSAQNQPLTDFLTAVLQPHALKYELVEAKFIAVIKPQSAFVSVKVVDAETGQALPFATVRRKGTYLGSVADEKGDFNIIVDNPLDAVLEFSYLGYLPHDLAVANYDGSKRLSIALRAEVQELQEVVVKEYLNNGITTDDRASKITIKPQEMEILPGLSERDILLSSQILAGINSNDESASGINVRGSSRDNTFIYWNNIPVYQPAHYFGNISAFIPSSIGRVDIYKNHIPVDYSGASAALILVESRNEIAPEVQVESSINLTHADLYAQFPLVKDKMSLMLAGRRSFNDLFLTPTFNAISDKLFDGSITQDIQLDLTDGDFNFNSKLSFSDINLQWLYEPSGKDRFKISAMRSLNDLDFSSADEEEINSSNQEHDVSNTGFNFQWDHRWGAKWQTNLSASYSDYDMEYSLTNSRNEEDDLDNDQRIRFNTLNNLEVRLTTDFAITENQVLTFGYQYNWLDVFFQIVENNFLEEDFTENIDSRGSIHGFFADYTRKVGDKLQLGAGLRLNNYRIPGEVAVDPQLRLTYEINEHLLFKSSWGKYRQYLIALQEAEFTFSNAIEQQWIVADEEESVPLVVNDQLVIGFLFDKSGWLIDLDLYNKNVNGQIARNFGPSIDEDFGFSVGNERILGLDFTLKRRWKHYRAWLSYSFQDSNAELPELDIFDFTSSLNIRHQMQVSQTLNLNRYELSLGYTLKSGFPFTDADQLLFIDEPEPGEEEEFEPFYEIEYDDINASRLPIYHRVDVSAWYKFPKLTTSKVQGEIGLSILNLLNTRNSFNRTFTIDDIDEDTVGLIQLEKPLLGITPNVSVRIRF
ncbi:MAG: TonB-dependent receptor [Bacteroidota bacterium]